MDKIITKCRKYFNEARYPYAYDVSIYTYKFVEDFVRIAQTIRQYTEEECVADIEDLKKTYSNNKGEIK